MIFFSWVASLMRTPARPTSESSLLAAFGSWRYIRIAILQGCFEKRENPFSGCAVAPQRKRSGFSIQRNSRGNTTFLHGNPPACACVWAPSAGTARVLAEAGRGLVGDFRGEAVQKRDETD